jgi:sulfur carrier protein ThiS
MDINYYIGLPFKGGGREIDGLDCWGLARLYYHNELGIDLPSFNSAYHIDDSLRIQELISQYREGWDRVETPSPGDLVVFNVLGEAVHLGIVLDCNQFLHIREDRDSVIENLNGVKWNRRIEGYYRYNPNTGIVLNMVPHPLKTEVVTKFVVEGTTVEELYHKISGEYKVSDQISNSAVIMVNGVPVPREVWGVTTLKNSDRVEYRAVAGKEAIRLVALIAVAYFAPYLLNAAGVSGFAAVSGSQFAMTATTFTATVAQAAAVMVGSALINAIAPIRPPSREDPGNPQQQNLITGSNNPYTPYGAIPVVLGKIRYSPPIGAKSFIGYPDNTSITTDGYLNMLLIWGYGPLTIDDNTMRLGDVPLSDFTLRESPVGKKTLDRKTVPTATDLEIFNGIYGNDVDQYTKNLEMTGPDYNPSTAGTNVELPPYVRPQNSNGTAMASILFDIYRGQPVFPIPQPVPDDTIYKQT